MGGPIAKRIVLIVFDYMGYADIEPFGCCEIRTPNIRRLADEGLRFTDCYAPAPICGPSRAAMLTGRYPRRLGIERNVEPGEPGLAVAQKTIARSFKDAGFRTALYGKWHLGHAPHESPNAHGFDDFLGFHHWNVDYYSHKTREGQPALYRNGDLVSREGYSTDLFTDAAVAFIDAQAAEPFFLYVAYNAMLPPYSPPGLAGHPESFDTWVNGPRADYVAAVEHLDRSVGRLLEALERHGLAEETTVLLTYDHGGGEMAAKGPFFHGFGTLWEGGIRVPMILRWPAGTTAGVSSRPAILMDVAATLLSAAGLDSGHASDGLDLLAPEPDPAAPRTLYWRIDLPGEGEGWRARAQRAVRQGDWKYLWDGGFEFLFDLARDPGERDDLGYRNPEVLASLRGLSKGDWDKR